MNCEDREVGARNVRVLEDLYVTVDFPLVRSMSDRLRLYQWP